MKEGVDIKVEKGDTRGIIAAIIPVRYFCPIIFPIILRAHPAYIVVVA